MPVQKLSLLWVILVFACFSCKKDTETLKFYTVAKRDYTNQIRVKGYLEPKNSINITCPRFNSDLTISYLIEEGAIVEPGDTVCILEAPRVESNYISSLKELEIAKSEYNKAIENLALNTLLLESQVKTIETSTLISSLDSIQLKFTTELQKKIIALEIKKAKLEREKLETKLRFLKKINRSELAKLQLKIQQSKNKVARAKGVLDKLVLTTRNAGLIVRAHNRATGEKLKEGDIVWNRRPIASIPDLSLMRAKLVLDEANFKRISPNQTIEFTIDAQPNILLSGKIIRKSGAGRPIKRGNPVKVYDVLASIDSTSSPLQPGLSITGKVIIDELSDTITIPLTYLFDSDSSKFVYLKLNNKFNIRNVHVAKFSTTHAVISEGLIENDIITAQIPSSNKIQ